MSTSRNCSNLNGGKMEGLEARIDLTSPELRLAYNMACEDCAKKFTEDKWGNWRGLDAAWECREMKVPEPTFKDIPLSEIFWSGEC